MKSNNGFLIINVLSEEYFNDCHIKYSVNVPLDSLSEYAYGLDRHKHIVVYCASYTCSASRSAWYKLDEMGFDNVFAYEGGMAEWYQRGFSMQGACKKEYLSTHVQEPAQVEDKRIKIISAEELKKLLEEQSE